MISKTPQANIFDTNALADLKRQASERSPAATKAVAQQFEALMTQMILKSMRASLQGEGMGSSETTQFYQGLADQQLSLALAKQGGLGLASALERLMNGQATVSRPVTYDLKASSSTAVETAPATKAPVSSAPQVSTSSRGFVEQVWPQAQEAARRLGVPPHFLVAQAALETGWGKKQIRMVDGSPSYNLFNLKAGKSWTGPVAEVMTTEFENGKAISRLERFRAYSSYEEAFEDYARLIGESPRYAEVLGKTDAKQFAEALQQGGYATDPAYASKLARVIGGTTMRQGMLALASSS